MVAFACETRDSSGELVKKTVDAGSRREALTQLERDGLFPIEISELGAEAASAAPARRPRAASGRIGGRIGGRRVKRKELLTFSLQLSSSINAGVPILVALESIARQTPNRAFQDVLRQMSADLEGGQSLSEALKGHPRTFPEIYASTVAAGEQTGSLDEVLDNLAEYLEAEIEVRADVRSALLYPVMVIATLGLAITVLVLFVIPRFAVFYSSFGSELPLPTRVLIGVSKLTTDYFPLVAAGGAALVYLAVALYKTRAGRRAVDGGLLRVPVIKQLIQLSNTLHVTQMLALFSQAGVPLLQGLRTIAATTSSTRFRESLLAVAEGVDTGETLADSMEAHDCLPPAARQMLAAGESTGTLERACWTVSRHFKKELRYLTKNLATLIEPLLTLVLAAIVLFVALAVFLPMWDMVKVIQ